jgi:hypothetical protein
LNLPLRGGVTLNFLKSAGSRCQGGVQGLLDQGRCTRHRDILLVINLWHLWLGLWDLWLGLWDLWLGFWDDWSWLRGDRLRLGDGDWSGVRGWCAVRGTHLY